MKSSQNPYSRFLCDVIVTTCDTAKEMLRRKIEEKRHVFSLEFSSSDNVSELSSSLNDNVPEISEGEFITYDHKSEPVATQEEAQLMNKILHASKSMTCIRVVFLARSRPVHGMYCLNNYCRAFNPRFVILTAFY